MDASIDLTLAETLAEYPSALLSTSDGARLLARARGAPRADGLWEGWLEFERSEDGTVVASTTRETTQPNHTDLVYWATGITPIYLEGALERADPIDPS